jgi:hypothetical protein
MIKNIFIEIFTKKPIQLYSKMSNYEQLGPFIVRKYVNKDNYQILHAEFKRVINFNLLQYIEPRLSSRNFKNYIIVTKGEQPVLNPLQTAQTFTHYSRKPDIEDSELAISNFDSEWVPHISLKKTNDENFISQFKKASKKHMSYLNLWSVNEVKNITISPTQIMDVKGSFRYIYCSYKKQRVYIELE